VILVAFFGLGGWAAIASIDGAVTAPGVVTVESKRQVIQHFEGGIMGEIRVREGDRVEEGQVLFRLDGTAAKANSDGIRANLDAALATEARLVAERDRASALAFPPELVARSSFPTAAAIMADQQAQFIDRKKALDGQLDILNNRIAQLRIEIEGLGRERRSAEQQLLFIKDELTGVTQLKERGLVAKSRVSALEREKARLDGLVGRNIADTAKARGNIDEMTMQIQQIQQQRAEEVGRQLVETRQKSNDLREQLKVASDVLERIEIRTPRDGMAQNVNPKIYAIGAVVRPGDTMLEVVPRNEQMIVDGRVSVLDIDRLQQGAEVEVRFPAFHSRTTPLMRGRLMSVSDDRLVDEASREPYYLARVAVQATDVPFEIKTRLRPGMAAEVVFNTGERTVLSYLLRPLVDALERAFRER
jgi:HlyD family secretion protein